MSENQIGLEIPQKELNFKIGAENNAFPVVLINESSEFASFQIELIAAGADVQAVGYEWYTISPDVSVKIPSGDLAKFMISIIETPIPGFAGILNITVKAFSIELKQEIREVIRINLQEGAGKAQLKVEIPSQRLQALPLENLEIPILISNPSQQNTNVTLSCLGLPESWFPKGNTQQFSIKPGAKFNLSFLCALPFDRDAIAKIYPFTIDVVHTNGLPSQAQSSLEVLPKGTLEVICEESYQTIPDRGSWTSWWKFWRSSPAIFSLTANNSSNQPQKVSFDLDSITHGANQRFSFELLPNEAEVEAFSKTDFQLKIEKSRSWIGTVKHLDLLLRANWQETNVNVKNEVISLAVIVKVIIPLFVLIPIILITIMTGWWISPLNPENPFTIHQSSITAIKVDGNGSYAISSSNDLTIRHWLTAGFSAPWINQNLGVLTRAKKAIRTVQYRPVDNDLMAAGLENGEIQILDSQIESKQPIAAFSYQNDDRVFGLEYTLDGRNLFSGHGSGNVLRWDLQDLFTNPPTQPSQIKQFDFAINAIALVGNDDSTLAIAGRYNQLILWNWVKNTVKKISYPNVGGQDDYIQSITVPNRKRNLIATADNQGYISVWDLSTCLKSDQPCQLIEGWKDAHSGKPVRSVAFSYQGCYLVSGGDDMTTKLWTLTANGKRTGDISGKTLHTFQSSVKAVDVHLNAQKLLVVAGTESGRVLGDLTDRIFNLGCDK